MPAAIFSPAIGVGRPGRATWSAARRPSSSRGVEIWYRGPNKQWKAVRLLGRVVAGREPGRTNDKQIIAFMTRGRGCNSPLSAASSMTSRASEAWGLNAPLEWFHQDKKYIP